MLSVGLAVLVLGVFVGFVDIATLVNCLPLVEHDWFVVGCDRFLGWF